MMPPARRIWIVGASDGIGAALAMELAARGHSIALSARNADALQALLRQLPKPEGARQGKPHLVAPCDVMQRSDIKRALAAITKAWQGLDSLVYLAGLYEPSPIEDMNIEQAERIVDVNLLGAMRVTHLALPVLRQAKPRGHIALCASVAGYRGLPNSQPYGATKAGMLNFAESLRTELGRILHVQVINPGFVATRLTAKNDFAMPMQITAEVAARAIAKGLESRRFEIAMPRVFIWLMKRLARLPYGIYFALTTRRPATRKPDGTSEGAPQK